MRMVPGLSVKHEPDSCRAKDGKKNGKGREREKMKEIESAEQEGRCKYVMSNSNGKHRHHTGVVMHGSGAALACAPV